MTEKESKEIPMEIPVHKVSMHEKEYCHKRTIVSVKVAAVKYPMPRRILLRVRLKDGSERSAEAHFVSMYNKYAYYFLYAADARELAPLMNQIEEVKAYETQ
jgi:hypothetical protein